MSPWVPSRRYYIAPYEEDPGGSPGEGGLNRMSLWPIVRVYMSTDGTPATEEEVTARVKGTPQLTEAVEEDLLELTHGDFAFELDNADGYFEGLTTPASQINLYNVTPTTRFYVRVTRETSLGPSPGVATIWAGVLDNPVSVEFDRKEQTVAVKAFSLSKLLEDFDASTYCRSFVGRTATTAAAGSLTCTWNDVTGLVVGDRFQLGTADVNEERFVVDIVTATGVVTVDTAFANIYTDSPITVLTPFYRDLSINTAIMALFALANVTTVTKDITQWNLANPLPSYLSENGLPITGSPRSIAENIGAKAGVLSCWWSDGSRYDSVDPAFGFTEYGVQAAYADWSAYCLRNSPPASLLPLLVAHPFDDGWAAYDPINSHNYRTNFAVNVPLVYKDNAAWYTFSSSFGTHSRELFFCDVDTANNEIWASYWMNSVTAGTSEWKTVRISGATGLALQTYSFTGPTALRYSRILNRMFVQVVRVVRTGTGSPYTFTHYYDQPVLQFDCATAGRPQIAYSLAAVTDLRIWSLRSMYVTGGHIAGHSNEPGGGAIVLWNAATGAIISKDIVAPSPVGMTGGSWAVWNKVHTRQDHFLHPHVSRSDCYDYSTEGSTTIPYADFSDMSVQEALRQIALFSGCYLFVTYDNAGWFIGRESIWTRNQAAIDLPTPALALRERPIFDWYRASVEVNASDLNGLDSSSVCGDQANTKDRLALDLKLPIPAGYAYRIGQFYAKTFGKARREIAVSLVEALDVKVRPTNIVRWNGVNYYAYRVETDLEAMEVTIKAFGV